MCVYRLNSVIKKEKTPKGLILVSPPELDAQDNARLKEYFSRRLIAIIQQLDRIDVVDRDQQYFILSRDIYFKKHIIL
jgi:hypothetical protein